MPNGDKQETVHLGKVHHGVSRGVTTVMGCKLLGCKAADITCGIAGKEERDREAEPGWNFELLICKSWWSQAFHRFMGKFRSESSDA